MRHRVYEGHHLHHRGSHLRDTDVAQLRLVSEAMWRSNVSSRESLESRELRFFDCNSNSFFFVVLHTLVFPVTYDFDFLLFECYSSHDIVLPILGN